MCLEIHPYYYVDQYFILFFFKFSENIPLYEITIIVYPKLLLDFCLVLESKSGPVTLHYLNALVHLTLRKDWLRITAYTASEHYRPLALRYNSASQVHIVQRYVWFQDIGMKKEPRSSSAQEMHCRWGSFSFHTSSASAPQLQVIKSILNPSSMVILKVYLERCRIHNKI